MWSNLKKFLRLSLQTKVPNISLEHIKVYIFWEGHKILQNFDRRFDYYYIGQIYAGGDFAKILWPSQNILTIMYWCLSIKHCRKEIGDFQIICSKVGGFRPFNYLLGVTCYLLSLKCKWLVLNKLCNFTAYKLFVSTNKQLSDPMDSMADPLFSSYSVIYRL